MVEVTDESSKRMRTSAFMYIRTEVNVGDDGRLGCQALGTGYGTSGGTEYRGSTPKGTGVGAGDHGS